MPVHVLTTPDCMRPRPPLGHAAPARHVPADVRLLIAQQMHRAVCHWWRRQCSSKPEEEETSSLQYIALQRRMPRCSPSYCLHARAGILGENLILPSAITNDVRQFWEVNGITLIVCLLSFLGIMAYIRWRRLL